PGARERARLPEVRNRGSGRVLPRNGEHLPVAIAAGAAHVVGLVVASVYEALHVPRLPPFASGPVKGYRCRGFAPAALEPFFTPPSPPREARESETGNRDRPGLTVASSVA